METKRIIAIIEKLQTEAFSYALQIAIELKVLSEKDPEFVEKLEDFLKHCEQERKR